MNTSIESENQIEFLFRNKCVVQDLYIQYMQNLNEINNKIIELENIILKKNVTYYQSFSAEKVQIAI
jgi:hypothetical protein